MLATELSNYYAEVKKHLDCPQQEKERLLCEANRLLLELQADDPFLDYDKIAGFFGEPEEIAGFLMQRLDEKVMASYERNRAIRKYLKIALVICFAIVAVWYVYYTVSFRAGPQVKMTERLIIEEVSNDVKTSNISDDMGGFR